MSSQKNQQPVILSCSHVSKKIDQIEILKDASFSVFKGEKIGLVGPNGVGKTTILKIIAGSLEKDSGVIVMPKKTKIDYLPQIHETDENLSGGEIAKKVLAPIISSNADLFLLDEPTNNLDVEGLEMVENFIIKSGKAFIIVSHDRKFLDGTVSRIIEINPKTRSSAVYDGNYSTYFEEKEARIARQWKEYADKIGRVKKFNDSIKERISWMKDIEQVRKNNKHLPMHEKEKPEAAVLRDKEGRMGRRARIMKDRLEKYREDTESIQSPLDPLPLKIEFDTVRGSTKVFDLVGVEKMTGKKKIGPIDFHIQYGDRIHITGDNGAGKTTLLRMLLGEIALDHGVIEKGENVKIGYISQKRWNNRLPKTVLEEFLSATELTQTIARKLLNRFRITAEDVKKSLTDLSPGEYSRLVIAELVGQSPNCIILDEPTNHLDLEVTEELEKALQKYEGTLIVVSHDRYFVEKLGLDKALNMNNLSQ